MAVETISGPVTGQPAGLAAGPSPAALAAIEAERTRQEDERWKPVLGLPCQLSVDLPLPGFCIADLMRLHVGSVINTHWHLGEDVPLRINGALIGWSEFEVVNNRLAVRLTELA